MTWQAVARKDFKDASRSYLLWGLTAVFVFIISVVAVLLGYFTGDPTSTSIINAIHLLFQYIVPLIAIAIAFGAIVDERNSGSLKILLSLPHSREDVIFGKIVGRTGAFVLPLILGMLLPAIGMLAVGVTFEAAKYVGYLALTALFGIAFVSISTGLSASTDSRFRVLLGLVGFYFVFDILWNAINTASFVIILMVGGRWPDWIPLTVQESLRAFQLMSPTGDFQILKQALFSDALFASQAQGSVAGLKVQLAAMSMLLFWIALPILFGMWRFEEADL